jgi:hypothetical protein
MVPFLCGNHSLYSTTRNSVQENVKVVLQKATEYVKILQQFVTRDLDMIRLWSISGYGAFIVGSVFLVTLQFFIANVSQVGN